MTKLDHVVEAAMELSDDDKRRAAERILKLVPIYDPELEAAIAEGIADIRAGRVTDADDLIAELEAADRADEAAGL
jgi:predicted transcriptional regulator